MNFFMELIFRPIEQIRLTGIVDFDIYKYLFQILLLLLDSVTCLGTVPFLFQFIIQVKVCSDNCIKLLS